MRFRYIFIVIICFFTTIRAWGQELLTINGVISKNMTVERISQAVVHNLRTNDLIMSDELGWFTIKAAVGDTLLFTKNDFADLKIVVKNGSAMPVSMQPIIHIGTVTVQGESKRQQLNDVMAEYRKQGTYYDGKPPVLSFLSSPLGGLYELFGATPNKAKHFRAFAKEELHYDEVRRRYNPAMVKRVTHAPDSLVQPFMAYYTPSYEDMKEWNDYDLIRHVQSAYDYYVKNREALNLDEINGAPLEKPEEKKPF